ncbi:FAD-dependent oxidoreductase [Ottowia caeni]|uniref:NAD(P)/FAD-dependent oxidoreductase n=1 Tax=Ottowia caeni TaxID=2870339 RepID=UPI001E34C614|nr:FAD-binding oxidoreductase [Ottowia caeni]
MRPASNSVAVIGAGIVGLCVAHALREAEYDVTVIDPEPPGSQCSSGNAGALSGGSVAPLAMPGIWSQAFSMLLDSSSPLHIPVNYWLPALPWLRRFTASAKPERVAQIAQALKFLHTDAVALHRKMAAQVGCPELVRDTGQLHVYPDDASLAQDAGSWELKRAHGQVSELVNEQAIRALEPALSGRYKTGMFLPEDTWVAGPLRYAQSIASSLQRMGVTFVTRKISDLARDGAQWTFRSGDWSGCSEHVVLSAGIGSRELLRTLNRDVPLESQRGYHVQLPNPGIELSRVVVLADKKVFLNPLEGSLRVAGTVEFGRAGTAMNERRALLLKDHAEQGLNGLNTQGLELWMGERPCLPDSLPVLGPVPDAPGLWCAFGHGHLGLTGSVNTGKLLARAIGGRGDAGELTAFSLDRF